MSERPGVLAHMDEPAEVRRSQVLAYRKRLLENKGCAPDMSAATETEWLDLKSAAATLYTQYVWCLFASSPHYEITEKLPRDHQFWDALQETIMGRMRAAEQRLLEVISLTSEHFPDGTKSPFFVLNLAYTVQKISHRHTPTAALSLPVIEDLANVGVRFLQALFERYRLEYDITLPYADFQRFVTHPSLKADIAQLQLNTHAGITSFFSVVAESAVHPRLSSIDPSYFHIDRATAAFAFSRALVPEVRNAVEKRLGSYRAAGFEQQDQRNCPVQYTRQFQQMWSWLTAVVAYQAYDDRPYPFVRRDELTGADLSPDECLAEIEAMAAMQL